MKALGEANGSATARSTARRSIALWPGSSSSVWNCSFSVMYCASESVPDVHRWSSRSIRAEAALRVSARSSSRSSRSAASLRRGALEHAADFDAVVDVLHRELGGDEPAGRPGGQQPFLLQPIQDQPQRRARDLQPGGQRNLAQPLARAEFAPEQQFAHLQERTKSLRFEPLGAWFHQGAVRARSLTRRAICMQSRELRASPASTNSL